MKSTDDSGVSVFLTEEYNGLSRKPELYEKYMDGVTFYLSGI